jgi:hypothetical protein
MVLRTKAQQEFSWNIKKTDISRNSKHQRITTIFAEHMASLLAIPENMFIVGVHEPFSRNDGVYITTESAIMKFSCIEKSVNSEQRCSSTGRAIYQLFQILQTLQATERFSTQTLLAHRYVI